MADQSDAELNEADEFRFRRHDTIGIADAEQDAEFLAACFVDTGDLSVLRNPTQPYRIVVGRTGSGKTALLQRLIDIEPRAIRIQPESLALPHISNSSILNFVSALGVNLDIFFRLLWRHVFAIELLKARFGSPSDSSYRFTLVEWLTTYIRRAKHRKAIEYLEQWGETFWEETDYRVREVTTKLESELKSAIESRLPGTKLGLQGANALTEEQKQEVIHRAQHVVNQVQIKELSEIIDLLDEALDDPQQRYYLVIDRLDENWVDERIRYLLIRALIETVRDFFKIRNAKIVLAIRLDLLDRVFRLTRDAGFQEEKYRSLYLRLTWDSRRLTEMLDARINHLVTSRYAKRQRVGHKDVLPRKLEKGPSIDYMISRTLLRPRDLIAFFNRAIARAVDNPRISSPMVLAAEGEYSRERLRSLADEWHADYPNLLRATELLKSGPSYFKLGSLTDKECEDFCLTFVDSDFQPSDDIARTAHQVVMDTVDTRHLKRQLALIFYRVGIVGLKIAPSEAISWVGVGDRSASFSEISDATRVHVHPCFWRALGVRLD